MLTKLDITKLKEVFVTKEEFRSEMSKFATRDEFKELKAEFSELKSMIHEVIFELKDMREEFSAITYRNREHSDTIESHGVRITTLEEKLSF